MNINIDNNKGQQKVVTRNRLQEYVNWLNQTNGGSYLRVTSANTVNAITLTITSMLADANGGITAEGTTGIGTVHWERSDTGSTPASTAATGSITIIGTSRALFPMGKFWLENGDKKYTVLDNTITNPIGIQNLNFSGYTQMTFNETAGNTDPNYCITYNDLVESTYARYFNSTTMADGLVVNSYSIDDGKVVYDGNQLVVEKDVNYGKLTHNLEISHITLEIDAMTDIEEYRNGYIPYADSEIKFVDVKDVKYDSDGNMTSSEPVTDFTLSKALTDNSNTAKKDYTGVTLSKDGSVAKAAINGNNYQVTVYYYSDEFTLTSTTISTPIGTAKNNVSISGSTALGTGTQRRINVSISATGALTFDIKQRGEVYGYFPVDVYRNSIDENGNVELSARKNFINSTSYTASITSYTQVASASNGWLDNAGDNFGAKALSGSKVKLNSDDSSVYDSVLAAQGVTDANICGQDVYNTNSTVYDRGVRLGDYHMAYANDAYGNMNYTGGLRGTQHLFIDGGSMSGNDPQAGCCATIASYSSEGVTCFEYSYDNFLSEYTYNVFYKRAYYKDMHAYGRTSILRRFRKIGNEYLDSANSTWTNHTGAKVSGVVNGNTFPKHVTGKTIICNISYNWNEIGNIKSGDNNVSGWTTVFEKAVNAGTTESVPKSGSEPTVRDVKLVSVGGNDYKVSAATNTSQEYSYYNIAPKFYMVDAEACSGATSSGYVFSTVSSITDTTNGTSTVRNYQLDEDKYLDNPSAGSIQKSNKVMLVYNNVNSSNVIQTSNSRFGSYKRYVLSSCSPAAPLEEINWIDSYAPNSTYGGSIARDKNVLFVDNSDKFIDNGHGKAYMTDAFVPGTDNWSHFNNEITLDDVNDFNDASLYSFAGETEYTDKYNNSSHIISDSVGYAANNSLLYSSTLVNNTGYTIYDSNLYGSGTYHAVSSQTEYTSDDIYSGNTYQYFGRSGAMSSVTKSSTAKYKFVPMKKKNNGDALRPCNGKVTVPYWFADINFVAKSNIGGTLDHSTKETFDLSFSINGHTLTESGSTYNGIKYQLITSDTQTINVSSGSFGASINDIESKPGYYAKFIEGTNISKDNQVVRKCTLKVLVVDDYGDSNGYFDVKVSSNQAITNDQQLTWKVNGRRSNSVDIRALGKMGNDGWSSYGNNNTTEKICIKPSGGNGVTMAMTAKNKPFADMAVQNTIPTVSQIAREATVSSHEGLYW